MFFSAGLALLSGLDDTDILSEADSYLAVLLPLMMSAFTHWWLLMKTAKAIPYEIDGNRGKIDGAGGYGKFSRPLILSCLALHLVTTIGLGSLPSAIGKWNGTSLPAPQYKGGFTSRCRPQWSCYSDDAPRRTQLAGQFVNVVTYPCGRWKWRNAKSRAQVPLFSLYPFTCTEIFYKWEEREEELQGAV